MIRTVALTTFIALLGGIYLFPATSLAQGCPRQEEPLIRPEPRGPGGKTFNKRPAFKNRVHMLMRRSRMLRSRARRLYAMGRFRKARRLLRKSNQLRRNAMRSQQRRIIR